jgi:hypothetical protein
MLVVCLEREALVSSGVCSTYLVLGRRTRGREGLGEVVIGSLLDCYRLINDGLRAIESGRATCSLSPAVLVMAIGEDVLGVEGLEWHGGPRLCVW